MAPAHFKPLRGYPCSRKPGHRLRLTEILREFGLPIDTLLSKVMEPTTVSMHMSSRTESETVLRASGCLSHLLFWSPVVEVRGDGCGEGRQSET